LIVHFLVLSIANIGAGFGLGIALGRRYRKLATRRVLASLATTFPEVPIAAAAPAPSAEASVPAAPAPKPPQGPLPKSPGHLAVDDLHDRVAAFGAKLSEADEQLRQCAATPDLGTIESVLSNIESTARNYAESRDSVQQRLADLTRGEGEWEAINNELVVAAQMQDDEIKAICVEIANFNYESDLAEGCLKIMGRTHRLLNSNDMLRDALQKALAEVSQQESRPPEECDRSDPLTGCVNRAAIEADLNAWWASSSDRSRLCVALIDIDRLAEANEQFGYRVGNEILKAIAKMLESNRSDGTQVARFSGQRFLMMFSEIELAAAADTVELCRQTIDRAHFEHNNIDIRITVSCALTRATVEDSPSSVLVRAEVALREAKRYGHNRTFLHNGKYPTPVVPPEIGIEAQHVTI
jgi:diguanylate cyclase (GGDEF)-like protein